jgi:putative transposase
LVQDTWPNTPKPVPGDKIFPYLLRAISKSHEDIYLKRYADGREAKDGTASLRGWNSTTADAFIRRLATARQWRSGLNEQRAARAGDMMDNAPATTSPQQLHKTMSLAA